MALNFPSNPVVGQLFGNYVWTGTAWAAQGSTNNVGTQIAALQLADATTNKSGLVPIVPPTVSISGGAATANSSGKITFTGATTSVALNNVFSSTYTNYRIVIELTGSSANTAVYMQLRKNSVNYTTAGYNFAGTASRSSGTSFAYNGSNATFWNIGVANGPAAGSAAFSGSFDVYHPWAASYQIITGNVWGADSTSGFSLPIAGNVYTNQTNDGFVIYPNTGNFQGSVQVLGYNS